MNKSISIEVSRSNVTLKSFLRTVKDSCARKGMSHNLVEADEFEYPSIESDSSYNVIGDKIIGYIDGRKYERDASEASCKSEILRTKPLDTQGHYSAFDGSVYNEMCEFTYTDEKKGYGYYFQLVKD